MENITLKSLEEKRNTLRKEVNESQRSLIAKFNGLIPDEIKNPFGELFSKATLIVTFIEGFKWGRNIVKLFSKIK
ncbi:MAG: hypothetical protein RR293_02050 [Bacteroidales bacterium]